MPTNPAPSPLPEGQARATIERALGRAEQKLRAYVGVCPGDKELTDTVLPMVREAIAALAAVSPEVRERDRMDGRILDELERMAHEGEGILLHDGSQSGRRGLGLAFRTLRDAVRPHLPAALTPPSVTPEPVLTWYDAGYRKRSLADETGLIVGCIHDEDAYLGGKHIGKYISHQRAEDAAMRAALAAQVRGAK